MSSLQLSYPDGYAFGLTRADDTPDAPVRYEPLPKPVPPPETFEAWTREELDEWVRAELRDMQRENGGGW